VNLKAKDDPRVTAWQAVAKILRADSELRSLNPVWQIPDGGPSATAWDDMPAENRLTIRITPRMGQKTRWAMLGHGRCVYEAPVRLSIEVAMPTGSNAADSMAVWSAIEDALTERREQDAEVMDHWKSLSDSGLFDLELETPGDTPDDGAIGSGTVILICHIEG
jgi:hypothetical protein